MLSSIIGPARPVVASPEDVATAKGVHRIRQSALGLVAIPDRGAGEVTIAMGERCLVCLEEYQVEEEARQLTKCSHLFHRQCIDEVCRFLPFACSGKLTMFRTLSGLRQDVILAHYAELRESKSRMSQRRNLKVPTLKARQRLEMI